MWLFIILLLIIGFLNWLPELILFIDARKEFKKTKQQLENKREYKITILKHPNEIDFTIQLINKKMNEETKDYNSN